ncbi:Clavaminate synthase-like protein [Meredithblackwellia eburnea MCA 4105]
MAADLFEDYAGNARKIANDQARKPGFNEIPIVDIAPFLKEDSTEEERSKVVEEVRYACTNVGFLYIKGHGLPEDSMDRAFDEARHFFDLSMEEKMEVYFKNSPQFRGYEPSKGIHHAQGDLKEAFNWGYEPEADPLNENKDMEAYLANNDLAGRNVWPASAKAANLRSALFDYYGRVLCLGRQMIHIFALALYLPETYFDDAFKVPGALGRILFYPSQPPASDLDDGTIGVTAHTDIECFTFLRQGADISCLQVLNRTGEWVEAPPIPGTLVLNIGDMLARWSNDRFISTVHRVINRTGETRQSLPIFFGPHYSTMITALPGCVPVGEKPKYAPIQAGEYVIRRLARSRLGKKYNEEVALETLVSTPLAAPVVPSPVATAVVA